DAGSAVGRARRCAVAARPGVGLAHSPGPRPVAQASAADVRTVRSPGEVVLMAIQLSVGPAVLTLNQGSTFMVTDLNGEIAADSEQGIFASDTRFVSYYAIFANGTSWQRLAASTTTY